MPVFNDFNHFYSPSYGSSGGYTPSYGGSGGFSSHTSSSPYSFSASSPSFTQPGHYTPPHSTSNYSSQYQTSSSNYRNQNAPGQSRFYTGISNNYLNYKRSGQYVDKLNDTKKNYTPSQYTTYSLWKDHQIASKWRNDNYKWSNQLIKDSSRPIRPVVIDTSKIDVSRPRPRRVEEPARSPKTSPKKIKPESPPKEPEEFGKPLTRDDQVGTIKRGRTVVRMFSRVLKENPYVNKSEGKPETRNEVKEVDREPYESKINRLSPVRMSRLKKRSVMYTYNRQDSDSNSWLSSDKEEDSGSSSDSDSEGSISRKSTLKRGSVVRSGTIKRDETLKKKDEVVRDGTIKRRYNVKTRSRELSESIDAVEQPIPKADRRLSVELYEEQSALLDSMIKEEFARKDADDYFTDAKRGTVKIKKSDRKLSSDSTTDEDEVGKKVKKKSLKRRSKKSEKGTESESGSERSTPSSSRRNSLFQDLIIGSTISENFIEELENKIQNNYSNPEKVLSDSKFQAGNAQVNQKVVKKPSRFEVKKTASESKIASIDEGDETQRPKTPKFYIEDIKIESSKFSFDEKDVEEFKNLSSTDEEPTAPKVIVPVKPKEKTQADKQADLRSDNKIITCSDKKAIVPQVESKKTQLQSSNKQSSPVKPGVIATKKILNEDKSDPLLKKADENAERKKAAEDAGVKKITGKAITSDKVQPLKTSEPKGKQPVDTVASVSKKSPDKTISVMEGKIDVKIADEPASINKNDTPAKPITKIAEKVEKVEDKLASVEKSLPVVPNEAQMGLLCQKETSQDDKGEVSTKNAPNESKIEKAGDSVKGTKGVSSDEKILLNALKSETTIDNPAPVVVLSKEDPELKVQKMVELNKIVVDAIDVNKTSIPPKENLAEKTKPKVTGTKKVANDNKSPSPDKKKVPIKKPKQLEGKIAEVKSQVSPTKLEKPGDVKDIATEEKKVGVKPKLKKSQGNAESLVSKKKVAKKKSEETQVVSKSETILKKSTKKKAGKGSTIVHMKPRAMTIRQVQVQKPTLKSPKTDPLPKPEKAVIDVVPEPAPAPTVEESSDESDTESSEEESTEQSSSSESDSNQGKQRTSSLDSGFGSCSKNKKGIPLQLRISTNPSFACCTALFG